MVTRTSVLGGETKNRGLLSGRKSKSAMVAWIVTACVVGVLLVFLQFIGLFISVVLGVVVFVATVDTGSDSTPWSRHQDRRRMKYRRKMGLTEFRHVSTRPEDLDPTVGTRAVRAAAVREWNAYREWTDGVDGLYWLECRPGHTAVAFHAPTGEPSYISVAFAVDGPIQGLHGDGYLEEVTWAFGDLLAGWGSAQRLVTGVETVTRVMPGDSAFHEEWLQQQLDPDAPAHLVNDYSGLLDELSSTSFVQRHYGVVRWEVSSQFIDAGNRRAEGLDGWLALVNEQLVSVERRLNDAKFRNVKALSGPRLAAVLRHLQHPGWPIDRASDVNVDDGTCWLPSHDEWSYTEVTDEVPDPLDPRLTLPASSWAHRTAQIPVGAMEVRELDGLWLAPLLTGLDEQVIRTVSMQLSLVPAREARSRARRDATSDMAQIVGEERKGKIVDEDAAMALSAANRRKDDLTTGTGHHGASWMGFITVSSLIPDLAGECVVIEDAADEAGINRLLWLDTLQSAAQSCTWPLARGMAPHARTRSERVMARVSSNTTKESLT